MSGNEIFTLKRDFGGEISTWSRFRGRDFDVVEISGWARSWGGRDFGGEISGSQHEISGAPQEISGAPHEARDTKCETRNTKHATRNDTNKASYVTHTNTPRH